MRLSLSLLAGVAALACADPLFAEELAFSSAPVSDAELAEHRGGFILPNGIDVSIAVQSDTRVNGVLLLRTVLTIDKGAPALGVFGRTTAAANEALAAANAAAGAATEKADAAAQKASTSSVNILNGISIAGSNAAAIGEGQEDLVKLDVAANGTAVDAAGGTVRLQTGSGPDRVTLSLPTLDVQHLVGQAYGTIAANRGNDVAIDTSTVINLDLRNVSPLNVGSSMFRAEALGMNAAAALGGR